MKLWKTLRMAKGDSAASKPSFAKQVASIESTTDAIELEDFHRRSVSESPDSGLPAERSTVRRITVQLDRRRGKDLGFILASRSEPGLLPTIAGFKKESAAQDSDRFAPGDRISSINGIATARLTNDEVLAMLDNVEERASLEVEYYLPEYESQNSLSVTTRTAQVSVRKADDGSLGITLRGGGSSAGEASGRSGACGLGSSSSHHHYQGAGPLLVTHVRPGGPAHATARIKPGDRLLKVDQISLANKSLTEAHQILQNSPPVTNLTIEYDISIMESVKFATGPLLIEIERGSNENLGLILTDKSNSNDECYGQAASSTNSDYLGGIYIENIIPASISDRCGALHPGDQILAVDDLVIENSSYTPEEVLCYVENCSNKGFTQLQIYPVHMILKNYRLSKARAKQPGSPMSGMSTLNSRKSHRPNRQFRQSSIPKPFDVDGEFHPNNFVTGVGVCRSEVLTIELEIPTNHDSGITVCDDRELLLISHITHQSPAYRSGCLQLGDRILSINLQQNLSAQAANEMLQKINDSKSVRYLNIKVEFNMADSVEASSGIFNVKLAKSGAGLGITITGNKRGMNSEEPMIISHIKVGSVAYRSGTLAVGDHLLAIDSQPLCNLSLEAAFNILQNFPDDIITLTVQKTNKRNDWNDMRGNSVANSNFSYSTGKHSPSINSSIKSGSTYAMVHHNPSQAFDNNIHSAMQEMKIDKTTMDGYFIFDLELKKHQEGPLGLTIAGSEDASQPIVVSGLIKGGIAERSGALNIGDQILFINGESVQQKRLSDAIKMLQSSSNRVVLKILRNQNSLPNHPNDKTDSYDNQESNVFTNNSQSSPGLASIDSAVESWDSQPMCNPENNQTERVEQAQEQHEIDDRLSYLPTDENKLLASGYRSADHPSQTMHDLPLPNYSFTNTLRTFKNNRNNADANCNNFEEKSQQNGAGGGGGFEMANGREDSIDSGASKQNDYSFDMSNAPNFNLNPLHIRSLQSFQRANESPPENPSTSRSNNSNNNNGFLVENHRDRRQYDEQQNVLNVNNYPISSNYQQNYDTEFLGFYNMESLTNKGTIHYVTLYKDVIYDDYGFSVSDGLYERGVYVNRIRKGGPADIVGLLRPFDRILQVNGTRTVDFDCCLTVPLIASAGDRIELVLQRLKEPWNDDANSNITEEGNAVVTKTI